MDRFLGQPLAQVAAAATRYGHGLGIALERLVDTRRDHSTPRKRCGRLHLPRFRFRFLSSTVPMVYLQLTVPTLAYGELIYMYGRRSAQHITSSLRCMPLTPRQPYPMRPTSCVCKISTAVIIKKNKHNIKRFISMRLRPPGYDSLYKLQQHRPRRLPVTCLMSETATDTPRKSAFAT